MYSPDSLISFVIYLAACLVAICIIAAVVNTKWFRRVFENASRRFTEDHHIQK